MDDKEWEREIRSARKLEPHERVLLGDFHRGSMGKKSFASLYELGKSAGTKEWFRRRSIIGRVVSMALAAGGEG